MRKALIGIQVLLILALSGCLKDERYEDYQMGINVTDVPGVALAQASVSPVVQGITAAPGAVVVDGPLITLEAANAASADVHVTLAYDQSLVTAAGLTPLPAGTFSLSTLTPVITAGSKSIQDIKLSVTNSTALDPNITYGIGVKIVSVDQGYQVVGNGKTVVLAFAIKNKYDGIYSYVSGLVTRYTSPGVPANDALSGSLSSPENPDVELITTGANSVVIESITWHGGGGVGGVGGLSATVDPVTNLVTMASTENATLTNWAGKENKYDPVTKTFTLNFRWNPATTTREYSVVLKYVGPR